MTIMDFFYVSGWTLILIYKLFFLCVIQTTVAKNAVGKFLKSSSLAKKKIHQALFWREKTGKQNNIVFIFVNDF